MKHSPLLAAAVLFSLCWSVTAADWPTYRGDAARTGFTAESLPSELSQRWVYRSPHAPQPAWPRSQRMPFDRAEQMVVADGKVFFGSSVDGAVRAVDADSGQLLWTYFTDAPIRFAPTVWRDRVLVASDDGHLIALAAADGRLLWKHRGGPDNSAILGNERLISKWPARGGPVVVDDVVYFAAGIWPSDGIYLYALDAATGKIVWVNDDSGAIYMPQPHGGASAESGVSAQGYLVVAGDRLFVPTGRAVPAAFDRRTGKFEYFHLQKYGHNGGAPTMAVGDLFFNSGLSFSADSGEKVGTLGVGQLAATRNGLVYTSGKAAAGFRWVEVEKPDRKGEPVKTQALEPAWSVAGVTTAASLIVTGDMVVSGGEGRVEMIDAKQQSVVWSAEVLGVAYGLAAANGKLLVSTDQGYLYCFDASGKQVAATPANTLQESPFGSNDSYAAAAEEIIRRTGVTRGYCVDLGCGDGSLAYELARRTQLAIYAVDDDPQMVELARKKLVEAGVYGSRVIVHHRDLKATGYPKYFADLIVSRRSLDDGANAITRTEAERLQRPFGGAICAGKSDDMQIAVRGQLPGAGSWTHQYANAANTVNSDDALVGGRLSMLWFRDVDFDIPQRHGRAPAPLSHEGRLFHGGLNGIVAVDAYNGRELWRYDIPQLLTAYNGDELMGVAGTNSNFCVHGDCVYVRDEGRCLRIDAANGTLLGEFTPPARPDGKPGTWGYIAGVDGMLFGTVANNEHELTYRYVNRGGDMSRLLSESHSLFAMDAETGQLKWQYKAEHSIRHNAIAIGGGRVYLIDRPLAEFDRVKKPEMKEHEPGRLVALDAKTGKLLWQTDEDVYGTLLALSEKHDALLMSYQPTRFRLDSEFGGRLSVFSATSGKRLWDLKATYDSRPMINDRTVYTQGGAWDLLTGEKRPFDFKRSYGCGILAGSQNMMLFRSATLGYFDLSGKQKTENYGGVRPGCWVNAIPAGGIVLVPDASAGCQCSYLNQAWFALDSESK
jgi:outer membrane protein assembly factor BamB